MYERGVKGWLKHLDFIFLDMLSLALALFAAFSLRFSQAWGSYQTELYRELLVMLMLLDFTMHDVLRRGMYQEVLESVKHAAIVFAVMTVLLVALKISNSYSRIILYGTSALHMVLGCALRQIYKKLLQKRIKHEKRRAVLIVAPEARAAEVAQMLLTTANDAFDLAGLVLSDRDAQGETLNGIPVVANLSDAAEYICREWVDEVFIEADAIKAAEKLVAQCQEMGVVVHEQLMLESGVSQKQLVEHIGHHLGLYAQKDEVADAGDLLIRAAGAAKLVRQRLCLGRRAVGQQHIAGPGALADRARHSPAHVAAADKTVFHGKPPILFFIFSIYSSAREKVCQREKRAFPGGKIQKVHHIFFLPLSCKRGIIK